MEIKTKVFEVRRTGDKVKRFIFERNEVGTWLFKAPEVSTYTVDELEEIVEIIESLYENEGRLDE